MRAADGGGVGVRGAGGVARGPAAARKGSENGGYVNSGPVGLGEGISGSGCRGNAPPRANRTAPACCDLVPYKGCYWAVAHCGPKQKTTLGAMVEPIPRRRAGGDVHECRRSQE